MAIRVSINHKTEYQYDRLVSLSPHIVRLRPAAHTRTPIHSYSLKITPEEHFINWQQDPYGNYLARLAFPEKTKKLCVKVDLVAVIAAVYCCTRQSSVAKFVGAVRFKAWQPPSGLHPMMAVHTPLVFDSLDTWNQLSIGDCTYYSGHPGGRHEEAFPVNANEAESQRIARFRDIGHTPGKFEAPKEETSRDYPYTLDLRKQSPC